MGAQLPKQYHRLAGRTVLEWSLRAFLARADFQITIVLAAEDREFSRLECATHPRIRTAEGGAERADSVRRGLESLSAAPDDWVLVHDAARPCLDDGDLARLIEAVAADSTGGLLAVPVTDTLKSADSEGRSCKTVPRESLWRALTPQMFRYGILLDALRRATRPESMITDEAAAIEAMNLRPRLVAGRADNIKITAPEDLILAESILHSRRWA